MFGARLGSGLALALLALVCVVACDDARKKPPFPEGPALSCAEDKECEAGRCDPFVGCVQCLFDGDCDADARCVEQMCHAVVACAGDADCESGSCDANAGRCAECHSDADCGRVERCSDATCIAFTPCEADRDCGVDQRCDGSQSRCVGCLNDDDCAVGAACSEGKCLPHCKSDDDCPSVYHCTEKLCALDVCDAGKSSCSSTGSATVLCTESGDSYDLNPCGVGRTCGQRDGVAECQKSVCAAEMWACDDVRQNAELCSADGLEVVRRVDCALDGKVCDAGTCVAQICEPGVARCDGNTIATCNASGSDADRRPCSDGERCDADAVECVTLACTPGSGGCIEETIATCNDEGSGYEVAGEDCAASQLACWEAACQEVVCIAGFSCVDGNSFECTANRTALGLAESCAFRNGRFCDSASGQCQDFVCEPGQPTCDGDLATSCADDGSHPLDFGIDCAGTNKVCWAAECLVPICEDDSYACSGSELKRCINKGTAFEVSKNCGEGTVCDAAAGTCRLQKCVPNQPTCDGLKATTCDATGLDFTGGSTDCGANGNVCVSGACTPVICTPNAIYCTGNELRRCGVNGGAYDLVDACMGSEFCDVKSEACSSDVCTPGAPLCSNGRLTSCNDDGSGPAAGGTDCAVTGTVCDHGACRSHVCVPNARFCDSGDVVLCNAVGTTFAPYDHCRSAEFCDEALPDNARCSPDLCPQGGYGCSTERVAECNSDGSGYVSVGVDCRTSDKVCELGGTCSSVALDEVGAGGTAIPSGGSAIHFQMFHVLWPRQLVEIEAGVSLEVAGAVTWVLYRSPTELGTFTLLEQTTSAGAVIGGYTSSGSLAVKLEQGNYYLVGIALKGSHSTTVLDGGFPTPAGFGQMLGGFTYNAGPVPTIPIELVVSPGLLDDDVALRVRTTAPP